VSAWEIATKERIGKLIGPIAIASRFLDLVAADGFELLPISARHAITAGMHVGAHRDPFDRLLAAQAVLDDLTLVSRDAAFSDLGVTPLW
jgi:PIN domain nuclease of toxin-antitoxin system